MTWFSALTLGGRPDGAGRPVVRHARMVEHGLFSLQRVTTVLVGRGASVHRIDFERGAL